MGEYMNESFRRETKIWLEENAPKTLFGTRMGKFDGYWGGRKNQETGDDVIRWFNVMKEKGWTAAAWPKEWGGGGLLAKEAQVLDELLQEYRLPPPLVGFGLTMMGPTLLDFGSVRQKAFIYHPYAKVKFGGARGIPSRVRDRI